MIELDNTGPQFLEAKELCKSLEGRMILNKINLKVQQGTIVGLLGPNGAGKTTAFYSIAGLLKPDSGSITFLDQEITHLPAYKRARLGLGFLSQEPSIFKDLSVEQNLQASLELQLDSRQIINQRIEEALSSLHLSHLRKKKALVLSGGERRRLEIARTLIHQPKFILLDEPFANVDPITIHDVQNMTLSLKSQGIGILITDHNAREIFQIADYCFLMSAGQVLAEGTPAELVSNELVRERYLGKNFKF
jgi:lipopolysaccharide export system ATP-binding protein